MMVLKRKNSRSFQNLMMIMRSKKSTQKTKTVKKCAHSQSHCAIFLSFWIVRCALCLQARSTESHLGSCCNTRRSAREASRKKCFGACMLIVKSILWPPLPTRRPQPSPPHPSRIGKLNHIGHRIIPKEI